MSRRNDPKIIVENIEGLSVNDRAYGRRIVLLRNTGELAVPLMIDYLRNPAKSQYHLSIRRVLVDMNLQALNPLLAATEMDDNSTLLTIISIVTNIGQREAIPYLARIVQDKNRPAETRQAAATALQRFGFAGNIPVADLFFRLAVQYYYNQADVRPDLNGPVSFIWTWSKEKQGLDYKSVPPAVFCDLMAMRECRHAMESRVGAGRCAEPVSVGQHAAGSGHARRRNDQRLRANRPTSDYFNASAGPQYLNAVLTRNLADHNAPVSLKVIKSLAQIVGPSSQGAGATIDPLVQAMSYPDRLVRFEAAFALAERPADKELRRTRAGRPAFG